MDDEPENDGKKGEGGGGDKGEAIELLSEIDQVSDDRAKGHDSQSNEHVQSGVKLGEILLREHSEGEGCGTGELISFWAGPVLTPLPNRDAKWSRSLRGGRRTRN